ncbi:EAL and GGDEF domain-containing protein [Thiomicrospira sp. R3]|uniref:GGDEF domain-containing protein n=1 Tax=Thiomicrospira sp. R3 TaxID=3035472 RepID=UPI00259B773E|nr:bifunctional diguanylate cyclase/phosphodiesterase [Thiomicrospira sp. R3]WFE69550.1 EAL and GGDEF domain-containing protein [Thiomicrospira sp. R3]
MISSQQASCQKVLVNQLAERMLTKPTTNRLGIELASIFEKKSLKPLFQPIIDLKKHNILGHEALIRGPVNSSLFSPMNLFQAAEEHGCLFEMDWLARSTAITEFQRQKAEDLLFINITVNSIVAKNHQQGMTLDCMHELGIPLDRVVIEITELQPVEDFNVFIDSINHYRKMGFKVALDDLGGGYNGLRLWSELRPDFVKIDRHFILGIAKDRNKRHFLESIKNLAQGLKTKLVAEGIENEADLKVIESIGIDYVQGYLFRKPQPLINKKLDYKWPADSPQTPNFDSQQKDLSELLTLVEPLDPNMPVNWVSQKFLNQHDLDFMPVVDGHKVLGMVWRRELMDTIARRFGLELNQRKSIVKLMDDQPIVVDMYTPVEQLSRLITESGQTHRGDVFIITQNGEYAGCGRFLDLLRLMTDLKVKNAQYANPLSGLPGNVPIQRYLQKLIGQKAGFCVIYVDADHFKPYNDFYSYDQGDDIIRMISELIQQTCQPERDFIGHIGGDDFMVISPDPTAYDRICKKLLSQFNQKIKAYYHDEDIAKGGISGLNREGESQFFPLMSLSLGVLVVPPGLVEHQQKLAGLATKAKKQAKHAGGNTWAVIYAEQEPVS